MPYTSDQKIKTAERLQDLRRSAGLSYMQLSDALKKKGVQISHTSLKEYEETDYVGHAKSFNKYMSIEKLVALSEFYEVSCDYLLGIDEAPTKEISDAMVTTGLSKQAIENLRYCQFSHTPIIRAINTLLEDGEILWSIAKYLFYDFNKNYTADYQIDYKYANEGLKNRRQGNPNTHATDCKEPPFGASLLTDIMTNDVYKKMSMLEIQNSLTRLLNKENGKEPSENGKRNSQKK